MANEKRGEFEMEVGDETYVLRYPLAGLMELEKHFKVKGLGKIFKGAGDWGAHDFITVFKIGLKYGSEPDVTEEQVGEWFDLTHMTYYMSALTASVSAANTGEANPEKKDGDEDPTTVPKAETELPAGTH